MSDWATKIKGIALVLLGFFIPISAFTTDLLVGFLAFMWLLEGQFTLKWTVLKTKKWVLALLGLMALYLAGLLWGENHGGAQWVFEKTALLLALPIILTLNLSQQQLKRSLIAFLLAMLLSATLAILVNWKVVPHLFKWLPFMSESWSLSAFMPYTYHNVFLAISIILAGFLLFRIRVNMLWKLFLVFAIAVATVSLFTEQGRAGQIAFLVMACLLVTYLFKDQLRWAFLSLIFLVVGVVSAYQFSPIFQWRIDTAISEFHKIGTDNRSSVGARYMFAKYSWGLIQKEPLLGYGTGSFVETFAAVNEETAELVANNHKTPHNNYLFIWFELGLFGLLLFLSIFYFQLKDYWQMKQGFVRSLLPVMFLVIMFSDSYFHNHNSAILYAYLSGVLARYSL